MEAQLPAGRASIGTFSGQSGVSVSALPHEEEQDLLASSGRLNNRHFFRRTVLRPRVFTNAAPKLGLGIGEIRETLSTLPMQTAPSPAEERGNHPA